MIKSQEIEIRVLQGLQALKRLLVTGDIYSSSGVGNTTGKSLHRYKLLEGSTPHLLQIIGLFIISGS